MAFWNPEIEAKFINSHPTKRMLPYHALVCVKLVLPEWLNELSSSNMMSGKCVHILT